MQLSTPVEFPRLPFDLHHKQNLCFIGSCFAENVSHKFVEHKFPTLSNPFGVLYNPTSLANCINDIIDKKFDESQMINHDGLWHSFAHHGSFSKTNKEEVIHEIKQSIEAAHLWLKQTDVLFITFGTASVFEYKNRVVSNCHKLPAKAFARRRLSVSEIIETFGESLKKLRAFNPNLKVILTVSPVRYTKDGLHNNSLNKASLHLATESLIAQHDDCYYLPVYEFVIDELRDYRFFAQDMSHPSSVSVDYLWERISTHYFSPQTDALNKQIIKLIKAHQHRPLHSQPDTHNQFKAKMLHKASDLQKQHPELDLTQEISYFSGE